MSVIDNSRNGNLDQDSATVSVSERVVSTDQTFNTTLINNNVLDNLNISEASLEAKATSEQLTTSNDVIIEAPVNNSDLFGFSLPFAPRLKNTENLTVNMIRCNISDNNGIGLSGKYQKINTNFQSAATRIDSSQWPTRTTD